MAIYTTDGKVFAARLFWGLHNERERNDLQSIAPGDPVFTPYVSGFERRTGIWCAIGQTTDYHQWQWDCQDSTSTIPLELMSHCNYNFSKNADGTDVGYGDAACTGIQCMKRAEEVCHVLPDATGEIEFDATNYIRVIGEDSVYAQDAHWIYLKFVLRYSELPIIPFYQIGLFNNPDLSLAGQYSNTIQPDEMVDPGRLIYYTNSTVRNRHINQRDIIEIVIQF